MGAGQFVEFGQHLIRRHRVAVDRDDIAFLEGEVDFLRRVRRGFRGHAPFPHRLFGRCPRVFQHAAFIRDVQRVGVGGIRRAAVGLLADIDAVFLGIGEQLLARVQIPFAPRGDHLDARHQRIGGQLEAHLVVALARGPMRDRVGTGFLGDLDQALGDQRTRDRGTEQILALVDRVRAKHRVDEIAHELFAQIVDEDFLHAERLGLGPDFVEFFALADIGGERDHLAVIGVLQPLEDDRSIQAARIGQHHFVDVAHRLRFLTVAR